MKTLNLVQGTKEWQDARKEYCTASEAPIIMGDSPYVSRDELLRMKSTNEEEVITKWKQKVFDKGHQIEPLAREIAEAYIGQELYPVVGVKEVDGVAMLASLDGSTMLDEFNWECKQHNKELHELLRDGGELTGKHFWQLEHQLVVSGAEKSLFTVSDGTEEGTISVWYKSRPDRREQLILGWKLFLEDLENYKVIEPAAVKGNEITDVPELSVKVQGKVIESSLDGFKSSSMSLISKINTNLHSEKDFADAEVAIKWCKEVESKIDLAINQVLDQTGDIQSIISTLGEIKASARDKRLVLNKPVTEQKKKIKQDIIDEAQSLLVDYFEALTDDFLPVVIPMPKVDFESALKGKKSKKTLQSSANDVVAKTKIEIRRIHNRVDKNLEFYDEHARDYQQHFSDIGNLCMEDPDSFRDMVESRISYLKENKTAQNVISATISNITTGNTRPSDREILDCIANHFKSDTDTVIEWLLDLQIHKIKSAANSEVH